MIALPTSRRNTLRAANDNDEPLLLAKIEVAFLAAAVRRARAGVVGA